MMTHQRCAICDCDRNGNVWPESAESLCADHWLLGTVRSLVRSGVWSEFDADAYGVRPNHAAMMMSATAKPRYWQAVILAACNVRGVWWDAGDGDTRDSLTDRYTLMTGLVPTWIYAEMLRVLAEQRRGRAA